MRLIEALDIKNKVNIALEEIRSNASNSNDDGLLVVYQSHYDNIVFSLVMLGNDRCYDSVTLVKDNITFLIDENVKDRDKKIAEILKAINEKEI